MCSGEELTLDPADTVWVCQSKTLPVTADVSMFRRVPPYFVTVRVFLCYFFLGTFAKNLFHPVNRMDIYYLNEQDVRLLAEWIEWKMAGWMKEMEETGWKREDNWLNELHGRWLAGWTQWKMADPVNQMEDKLLNELHWRWLLEWNRICNSVTFPYTSQSHSVVWILNNQWCTICLLTIKCKNPKSTHFQRIFSIKY